MSASSTIAMRPYGSVCDRMWLGVVLPMLVVMLAVIIHQINARSEVYHGTARSIYIVMPMPAIAPYSLQVLRHPDWSNIEKPAQAQGPRGVYAGILLLDAPGCALSHRFDRARPRRRRTPRCRQGACLRQGCRHSQAGDIMTVPLRIVSGSPATT